MGAPDLETYRRDAEAFLTQRERAEHGHYAGFSRHLDLAPVYERYGHLFDEDVVVALVRAIDDTTGEQRRSARAIARFATDGAIGARTRTITEELATRQATAEIVVDGRPVPWRGAPSLIANEPEADRRARIARAQLEVVDRTLNPLLRDLWDLAHESARDLGARSYDELYDTLGGVDLNVLAGQCESLLTETDDVFRRGLDLLLSEKLGVTTRGASAADLTRLWRVAQTDELFPPGRMMAALHDTLAGLGIDPRRQPNIVIDAEARATKDPRAFCSPVRVPDEVYLVVAPIGGAQDYRALFHETGHAQHFGGASRDLAMEFRHLGDDAVTEAYAFLFEGLVSDPAWLERVMGVRPTAEHRRTDALLHLYRYRRYAAKLLYERILHSRGTDGAAAHYAELLSRATHVPWPEERHLQDVDPGYYAVCYLRAWALWLALRSHLRERFGSRWFASRGAGGLLRELWNEGQRMDADEIVSELGLPALDLALLTHDAGDAL